MQPVVGSPPNLIYLPPSYVEPLNLLQLFPTSQPLEVELGSGDGSFLVEWARQNPAHNFIGVERLLGRIRKLSRKGLRAGLSNLRGIRLEAAYFMEYLLPLASVHSLHVYFPDPWPKRKHRKHRLVDDHFTAIAAKILVPGGTVYLRTDHPGYFAQMTSVFDAHPSFRATGSPPNLRAGLTDFEREFHTRGVATLACAYQLQASQ